MYVYMYVYISGIPGVPQLYVGTFVIYKMAYVNVKGMDEPNGRHFGTLQLPGAPVFLRASPAATVQFLWHDW